MLEINNSLSEQEGASHYALWAIMKAPLLIGTDLTAASPATLAVLGNQDLLKINQDPLNEQARMLTDGKDHQLWGGALSGGGFVLMAIDTAQGPLPLTLNAALSKLPNFSTAKTYTVTDVWKGGSMGEIKPGQAALPLKVSERHGNALVTLTPK